MIIITGTFRNTSNSPKTNEITLFPAGSSAYYSVYKSTESSLRWRRMNFKCVRRVNFHRRDLKFSDLVSNTVMIMNKNKTNMPKIDKISRPYPLWAFSERISEGCRKCTTESSPRHCSCGVGRICYAGILEIFVFQRGLSFINGFLH